VPALGVGIVGARFAADLHAVNYRPLVPTRVRLAAVCSRTRADVEKFAKHHDIPRAFTDVRQLVECPDVDVVDVCSTTDSHHEIAIVAARAGKHVIVEKPLTGFFGDADVDRQRMLDTALRNSDAVLDAVAKAGVTLCYAEDFVYAPPVAKLRRLLDASGGVIMELRAEESHSGSHSAYARRWRTAGGGALLRMGSHPVGVVLHLKHYEGLTRAGRPIRARSVLADVAQLTKLPGIAGKTPHHRTAVEDVEDWSVALITFEDGTKATVHSNDVTLGGVRNTVTAYLTNAVINANITPSTTLTAYAPDAATWRDEYISEKVETKAGWQYPSPDEDWIRGYPQELADFVDAITMRREPLSGGALARETVEVIYAGYLSAATGRRVDLARV
jgi:predicted dehydrogenase